MKKCLVIILGLFLLTSCEKILLPRDNPLDENNNENQIAGVNLKIDSYKVYSDSNNDGIVNKGEKIGLGIKIKNTGRSNANSVKVTFECNSSYVSNFRPTTEVSYGTIYAGYSYYELGYSYCDFSTVTFTVSSTTPTGTSIPINVTMTDAEGNEWTDSFTVVVSATDAELKYDSYKVYSDSNKDGIVNKGEKIGLGVKIKNTGSSNANSVKATFTCNSSYVSNFRPTTEVNYGTMYAGYSYYELGYSYCDFSTVTFTVSSTTPTGTSIPINVTMTDAEGNEWTDSFTVVVSATDAELKYDSYKVYSDSNKDGIVNKGEKIGLGVKIKNTGSSNANSVKVTFTCNSSYVSSFGPTTEVNYGTMYAGYSYYELGYSYCDFSTVTFTVSSATPTGTSIPINVTMTDAEGNQWTDSFYVTVN